VRTCDGNWNTICENKRSWCTDCRFDIETCKKLVDTELDLLYNSSKDVSRKGQKCHVHLPENTDSVKPTPRLNAGPTDTFVVE
jgi:hypothetical protein